MSWLSNWRTIHCNYIFKYDIITHTLGSPLLQELLFRLYKLIRNIGLEFLVLRLIAVGIRVLSALVILMPESM